MNNNELPSRPEIPFPLPRPKDIVLLDGRYTQCIMANSYRIVLTSLDQQEVVEIDSKDLHKYTYVPPTRDQVLAKHLVTQGAMTQKELSLVRWGSEEKQNPHLKGEVTFFGTYTKKDA